MLSQLIIYVGVGSKKLAEDIVKYRAYYNGSIISYVYVYIYGKII